jgi:hypothetical protein
MRGLETVQDKVAAFKGFFFAPIGCGEA